MAAHRSLLAECWWRRTPNRRRPRVPSGKRPPEKVAKPKAGPLYRLRARVACEALDFRDPASTERGIVITGGYRDDGGADCAQARYFDHRRGVVRRSTTYRRAARGTDGRYEAAMRISEKPAAPGNETRKMEESMQLAVTTGKTGEGEHATL